MSDDWVVGASRREAGSERIYAAALDLIVGDGLDNFDIDTLAARVHCSRATIYRYAGGKKHIRDTVLLRLAADIVDTVRQAVEGLSGTERVVTAVIVALEQIRNGPLRAAMLNSRKAMDMGEMHSSTVLCQMAADLTGVDEDDPAATQWIVRIVMSFANWPMPDCTLEEETIRRFVGPAFAK